MAETTLDPEDWSLFRTEAHRMLDDALDKMESAREGRVWHPPTNEMQEALQEDVPAQGLGVKAVRQRLSTLLPYGVGNTHPRFFGWVHGAGNPGGILAEMAAAAMNANLGGRDHGAIYVERQVLQWCRQIMGFPETSSGLIVSGTSMATIIALKVARDQQLGSGCRKHGVAGSPLVGYGSTEAHACNGRAFDLLGLGSDSLRKIGCDSDFRMDPGKLRTAIEKDRARGLVPFVIIGTAGSVNVGAIDDLAALADIAAEQKLWLHIDGAFGATAKLSPRLSKRLLGLERADSVAFDFHKWLHVNYDAGCVLIRSKDAHLRSFSGRPHYLAPSGQGLAAGSPWPVDFGPELSRGFRALKIWTHFLEHGLEKLAASIDANCALASYLGRKIVNAPRFELLAPVLLNIVCFRYVPEKTVTRDDLDTLNNALVIGLQQNGVAAPSTTTIDGKLAIRVNITNHRTQASDLDVLLQEGQKIGDALLGRPHPTR